MVCVESLQWLRVFYEAVGDCFVVVQFSATWPRHNKSNVMMIILGCLCSFQLVVEWKPQTRQTFAFNRRKTNTH